MSSERRVVHVVPAEPWGGIQALVPMLAREQVRQGTKVELIFLGSGGRIRELANSYGLTPVSRSIPKRLVAPLRLWQIVRRARGAIIHSHCEPAWASAMLALSARGRWVEHAHVYPDGAMPWKARIGRAFQRHFATRHIAISHSIGRALISSDVAAPASLDIVYNGVAVETAPPVRAAATRRFTLGFVGRVVAEKGIFDFVELAAVLTGDGNMDFAVYGDGADLATARALAVTLGVADRITFHGYVEDISSAWGSIAAAAMFSHREPFGLVFLEAALHGVPTISYDNDSGGSEVAATLESAHRVAPGDLADAARIVRALAAAPGADDAALARDRRTIAERFAIATMAHGVEASYRKLEAASPASRGATR